MREGTHGEETKRHGFQGDTCVVVKQWNTCTLVPAPGHPACCHMAPPRGVTHKRELFLNQPALGRNSQRRSWLFPPIVYPVGHRGQPPLGAISKGLHCLEKLKAIMKLPDSHSSFVFFLSLYTGNSEQGHHLGTPLLPSGAEPLLQVCW